MAFQIGQPGVSAFLQSLLRDLDVVIDQMGDYIFLPVNTELREMKKLLLGFEDVLLDGERKRQHGDKGAERWMDDLKDLFYDIDDLLDEVKMEKHELDQDVRGRPSNSEVRYNHYDNFFSRKNIENTIRQVLVTLRERTEEANRLQLKRDAVQHDAIWSESQAKVRQKPGCYADEPSIHGRKEDKKRIIEMLLADDGRERRRNYEFVCVVGMGGLGKTTLAQLVFQDEIVQRSFAVRSWACVSDVFDVIKVTKDLIESASERGDGAANIPSGLPALQDRLKKTINDKKFLVVLDDVWTTKEWEQLKLPLNFGAKGSKILVTTRLSKVAVDLRNKEPYQLEPLEYAQCLKIFNDNAFGEEDGIDNDRGLMKIGEEIVRKCKGVPLVAKVMGGILTGKDEGEWKAVKDDGIWDLAYKGGDLHPGLRLSYFYLPPYLKRCFEYFALFPTDSVFDQRKLVRVWMAEGLIEVNEGREPEEIGNQYYNDLKGRSLIQEDDKMHDMVHHLACIVSGSSFFCVDSGSNISSTSSPHCVRHVFSTQERVLIDASKLRTLIHNGELGQDLFSYKRSRVLVVRTSLLHLPSSLGCHLKHLRYLNLTGMFLNNTLPDSICTLTNLQVLDLSYCEDFETLPQDMGMLSNLLLLNVNRTGITVLPDSICMLTNLRDLDLSYCQYLHILPQDVGKLLNLRFLRLQNSGIAVLPDSIRTLTNLQELDLSYCKNLKNLPEDVSMLLNLRFLRLLPDSICSLTNLRDLDLSYCEDLHILPQDVGKLLNLRFLRLQNSGIAILPDSIRTLTNLQELDLSYCKNLKNLPQDVSMLLNLRFLRLLQSGITVLPDSICTLTNLRDLDLSYCEDLHILPQDVGKLFNLRFLRLQNSGIAILPDSIRTLTNLQELDLSFCKDLWNLPEDVGNLLNLRFLELQQTCITVLPDSVCSLLNLQVLDLSYCRSLTTLPKDMGNLQSLHELFLLQSSISSLPESIVKATNIRVLEIDYRVVLPAHIGKLTKLEELRKFCVGKENGRGIDELKGMNRLRGSLRIENMENIESPEEALMANLRSKKHIEELEFVWKEFDTALTGRDGEMEVRVMQALEPNAAIKSLSLKNYVGHKFPAWMSTPPLHNLTQLNLINLPLMVELTGMEFESLLFLRLDNCPALREVSVTIPQLKRLIVVNCNEALKLSPFLKELHIWECSKRRIWHDDFSSQEIDFWTLPTLDVRLDGA